MIERIEIRNFKSIQEANFNLCPLNIFTGTNSSGKSSIIQAILLSSSLANPNDTLQSYLDDLGSVDQLLCVDSKERIFSIINTINQQSYLTAFNRDSASFVDTSTTTPHPLVFEENLYYLSANRIGQENLSKTHKNAKFGIQGEYLFGFYEKNQGSSIDPAIQKEIQKLRKVDPLLNTCVTFWFERILELDLKLSAQRIGTNIYSYYKDPHIGFDLTSYALGAGVSYLAKILIMGLSLKQGDIFIVENPEIHLHPKAISNLVEFFVALANSGIQVILETHSEHIINKTRYLIYKNLFSSQELCLLYRQKQEDFRQIHINQEGRYIDSEGNLSEFPRGFFDVDLKELLEMA